MSRSSIQVIVATAQRVLRQGPNAVRAAGVEALVVDQLDLAAGSVAEALRLPFVTICTSPPALLDESVPPCYFSWPYRPGYLGRLRNRVGNIVVNSLASQALSVVNEARRGWGLTAFRHINDVCSDLATITQLPHAFEFPRKFPSSLFYTGPFADSRARRPTAFDWSRLNGKPLVYASLGTVLNSVPWLFRTIAEACSSLPVQLVLSLGGGALCPEDLGYLGGNVLTVHYAPQMEILRRATVTITHAGLNTVLESLMEGVPLVAIPLANDEFGVAARIRWSGSGSVLSFKDLTAQRLRGVIVEVISDEKYRMAARRLREQIRRADGLRQAGDIVENVLNIKARLPSVV
jgi:zeaxanthin glucosyltransferase